jgi:hypothetical protein
MNGKDMQQDMAQNAMDNAAAERAAAEWDANQEDTVFGAFTAEVSTLLKEYQIPAFSYRYTAADNITLTIQIPREYIERKVK